VFVHAVCVAFWIGALIPLAALSRAGETFLPELRRFSRAMPFFLVALIAAGIALALVQVDRLDALWTTAYGIILSCKLAAVCLLLGLAAWNRFRLTPRLEQDESARPHLAASIRTEIAIVIVILGLVATWRFTPPPRVLAATAAEPVFVHFHTNAAMVEFTLDPVRSRQVVTLQLLNGEFGPLDAKEVEFVLGKPDAGIEPLRWRATHVRDGTWRVDNVQVPLGGIWRGRVEILINDFERVAIEDTIALPQ
jgi:copper transport protein